MKVLAINGSPHRNGNTFKLIDAVLRGARDDGHDAETVHLIDLDLDYCSWCNTCMERTPGICPTDDGFMDLVGMIGGADVLVVGCPSSGRSVTGYMKNWLDRFCNTQLIWTADEAGRVSKQSRLPKGKRSILIVQGCTNQLAGTIEPIEIVLKSVEIPIVERLIVPHVGLTEKDTIQDHPDVLERAFQTGRSLG